jgi:choline monooxygenase
MPSDWYTDPAQLEREYGEVFARGWQYVARLSDLEKPGSYVVSKLGRENILLARGQDGVLRGFSNVCRHRAGPVAAGCGITNVFRCKYHNWTYDLAGKLIGTPEFQDVENFDPKTMSLPEIKLATIGPLVFAALKPAMTFEEFLGEIPNDLRYLDLKNMVYLKTVEYPVQANWKVYVDNYLEGYHLGAVHPRLSRELDYANYYVKTARWYSEQGAPAKSTAELYQGGVRPGAHYYWCFPNFMLNIYQGILQTNLVIPDGPGRCTVRFEWFAFRDQLAAIEIKLPELMKFSDEIQAEDESICNVVQENLHSETYRQGRYSVKRENGVHHFHGLMAEMIKS